MEKQEMEMLKTIMAGMDANQARMYANRKIDKEEMAEKMNVNQAKVDKTLKETLAKMEAEKKSDLGNLKSMMERIMNTNQTDVKLKELTETTSADMKACREMTVCHEATEVDIGKIEPDSGMMQSVAVHQGVPREDATVMPVGEPRKRRRDRKLDARRRRKQQERTQKKDGCRKDLVAAHRGTTHRAQVERGRTLLTKETRGYCGSQKRVVVDYRKIPRHATVAWRKGHIRSTVERATQRVGRLRKNLQSRQEGSKATKDLGGKRPLYPEKRKTTGTDIGGWSLGQLLPLGRKGPTYKILKKTLELESVKQSKGCPAGYLEANTGHCGGANPLRNGRRNSINVRVAR
jgi:hypothetical protein